MNPAPSTSRVLLTVEEVSSRLGRPEKGVRHLIATGVLPAVKVGGRLMVHDAVIAELEESARAPRNMSAAKPEDRCNMSAAASERRR